jgi:hypothetical protein
MTETENVEKYARTKQNRKYLELIDSIH